MRSRWGLIQGEGTDTNNQNHRSKTFCLHGGMKNANFDCIVKMFSTSYQCFTSMPTVCSGIYLIDAKCTYFYFVRSFYAHVMTE